jgi:hypothetical protein
MDHLDNSAEGVMGGVDLPTGTGRQEQESRAQAFAPVVIEVVHQPSDTGPGASQGPGQDALDLVEISLDRAEEVRGRAVPFRGAEKQGAHGALSPVATHQQTFEISIYFEH